MLLPDNKGLLTHHTCMRRLWQRPKEDISAESEQEFVKNPPQTSLTTWCLPGEGTFKLNR